MLIWNKIDQMIGSNPNVSKFIFCKDDAIAESVLYAYPDYKTRTVICCSVMSGCPVGCTFCGTGKYYVRNLTSSEITSQVEHLIKTTNIDIAEIGNLQIMLMSMGEPFLNMVEVTQAIKQMLVAYPESQILVSTVAPKVNYSLFDALVMRHKNIGLQFSIHESTDENRNKLIPYKNKLSLKEIAKLGIGYWQLSGNKPQINYCAHENNISYDDASRLRWLFPPHIFNATVSVICETDRCKRTNPVNYADKFAVELGLQGYKVHIFNPAGQDDIGGGCGQLWFVQDWMKKHLFEPKVNIC